MQSNRASPAFRAPAPVVILMLVVQAVIGTLVSFVPRTASAQGTVAARDTVPSDSARSRVAFPDSARHVQRLEAQVITGTRLSAVSDRTGVRVDRLPIESAPPGPASTAEVLRRLPGVSIVDDQGSRVQPTLNMRGFTLSPVVGISQGVSVFLDGVRINEPDAQELNFDLVPMNAVSHAELERGPAALFGKNSLAGALVLTTKRGDAAAPSFDVDGETGAFGYHGATVTGSGVGAVGSLRNVDAYVMAHASDERGWRDDTGARMRMLFANVGRKSDSSDVAITIMSAHDRALLAGSLPESWLDADPQANYTGGDFFEPDLLHLALRGERTLSHGTLRGNLFFRRNNVEQFNANIDAPSTRALTANRSGGGTAEWSALSRLGRHDVSLTIGTEYSRNDVGYHTFAQKTPSSDSLPADCDQRSGPCEHARVPEDDAAFYAQAVLTVSPSLSLTGAARADYVRIPFRDLRNPENDGTNVFRQVSPRIGATYRLDSQTTGYASVSTGFRAPAALELACADEAAPCSLPSALGDDPPLDPVAVRTYEAGLDRALGSARVGVSAYRTDVSNDIVFVASTLTAGFFQNIPHTRRQGVEVTGDAGLPAGFHVNASYAYLNATYESTVALASELDDNLARPGDRFPLSPAHQATFALQHTHAFRASVLSSELSLDAVSSQFLRGDDANREQPLSPYTTAAARINWETPKFTVSAHVTNLFDRAYDSFGVFGENPAGPIGGPRPTEPVTERFLTPGYPRAITVSVSLRTL